MSSWIGDSGERFLLPASPVFFGLRNRGEQAAYRQGLPWKCGPRWHKMLFSQLPYFLLSADGRVRMPSRREEISLPTNAQR